MTREEFEQEMIRIDEYEQELGRFESSTEEKYNRLKNELKTNIINSLKKALDFKIDESAAFVLDWCRERLSLEDKIVKLKNHVEDLQEKIPPKFATKDHLPNVDEKVLVFFDDDEESFHAAWICETPDGTKKWTDGEMDYSIDFFKSWMPRPKPRGITLKDVKVTLGGAEVKDFGPEVEQDFKKKSYYTFNDALEILFINGKEFMQMKKIGKARFIKYADSDSIFLFDEDCIRHFFDDAEADELVAEIKSRAYERWLIGKEIVDKTSSLLGW